MRESTLNVNMMWSYVKREAKQNSVHARRKLFNSKIGLKDQASSCYKIIVCCGLEEMSGDFWFIFLIKSGRDMRCFVLLSPSCISTINVLKWHFLGTYLVLLKAKVKQNTKVFLWLTLFKKSVPVISIWGISVIPVRCCHGTPLENAALSDLNLWWLWAQRLLLELARQAENSRPSDTWHFSSSPIPIRENTVWNQNTREVLVSPLPDCLECSCSLNTHQHNLRNKIGRKACRFQLG